MRGLWCGVWCGATLLLPGARGITTSNMLAKLARLDAKTAAVAKASGFACPPSCGKCCTAPFIEASQSECEPLALTYTDGSATLATLTVAPRTPVPLCSGGSALDTRHGPVLTAPGDRALTHTLRSDSGGRARPNGQGGGHARAD